MAERTHRVGLLTCRRRRPCRCTVVEGVGRAADRPLRLTV